ncbi:MAG: Dabb family protein [Rhodobacteraceae bacterium]|nr:Dabb family protein [Paracoccaceae bacterium]
MHRHTVLFNFKDEVSPADRDRIVEALRSLKSISVVKDLMLHKNKVPPSPKAPFEWLLVADFANDDDRQIYEKDELHVKVIRGDFVPNVKNYAVADVNY